MSVNPFQSPVMSDASIEVPERKSMTISEILVIVVIIGILFSLLLPAVSAARDAARRSSASNNAKQIGLALHNYEAAFRVFPPAAITNSSGERLYSWRARVLPFIEQGPLSDGLDEEKSWNDPANRPLHGVFVSAYHSPAISLKQGTTTFLATVSDRTCLLREEERKIADLPGLSNLTFMCELPGRFAVPWIAPIDVSPSQLLALDLQKERMPKKDRILVTFADASIQTTILNALINRLEVGAGEGSPIDQD